MTEHDDYFHIKSEVEELLLSDEISQFQQLLFLVSGVGVALLAALNS